MPLSFALENRGFEEFLRRFDRHTLLVNAAQGKADMASGFLKAGRGEHCGARDLRVIRKTRHRTETLDLGASQLKWALQRGQSLLHGRAARPCGLTQELGALPAIREIRRAHRSREAFRGADRCRLRTEMRLQFSDRQKTASVVRRGGFPVGDTGPSLDRERQRRDSRKGGRPPRYIFSRPYRSVSRVNLPVCLKKEGPFHSELRCTVSVDGRPVLSAESKEPL